MSWSLKIKKAKGQDDKYKIYCSVSDKYLNKKYLSKSEIIKFIFWNYFDDFLHEFIELADTFPEGWCEKDLGRIKHTNKYEDFNKLKLNMIKNDDMFYDIAIDRMKKNDISLEIFDENYNISTNIDTNIDTEDIDDIE